MLDLAANFLVRGLNAYLTNRTGSNFGAAELCRFVDDNGKWAIKEDHLGVSLVNIEEDRVLRGQLPETALIDGRHVVTEPALRINLYLLFAANFKQYDQALRQISWVLMYFQANPAFTSSQHPGLSPGVDKLAVELHSLSFEQCNQMWALVGGKSLPSVLYKVRLVLLRDPQPMAITTPVTAANVEPHPQ